MGSELEDLQHLASLAEYGLSETFGWKEVLACSRVVLLAEAGSGKTWEMEEQVKQLRSEGQASFFLPLESLDKEVLTEVLSADDERLFSAWLARGRSPAWFFLDSVDELKLTQGKLQRALRRVAKSLDGHFERVHVVISSRPSDWRAETDLALIRELLPIVPQIEEAQLTEEAFLAPLRRTGGQKTDKSSETKEEEPKTLVLLPLNREQVETFAQRKGVDDTAGFITALQREDAWTFARRPMDLTELIVLWHQSGKLGTRAEQHEANVGCKLEDDSARPDSGTLNDRKARLGAERLALALAMTRNRMILSPVQPLDHQRREGVLNPADILTDWTPAERQTLLRRALFDPATFGRVRFHHRSVQEYLAACRLRCYLREQGMSIRSLYCMLFGERYGLSVVLPSMRPISAWLALWIADVRRELVRREPEILLTLGDPQSLPLDAKADLLRSFVAAYGKGRWRGIELPIDELRRLVQPELADLVRDLWAGGPENDDVQEVLLTLIWQGPLAACSDIAESAARDTTLTPYHRIVAVRALAACDAWPAARGISESILAAPDYWPARVVYGVAPSLFPRILNVDELLSLVERTPEPSNTIGGFEWALREIADDVDLSSETATVLRDGLARLIWKFRSDDQEWYELRSRYDYIAPALALLCGRQLAGGRGNFETESLMWCAVVAVRFGCHRTAANDSVTLLREQLSEKPARREAAFWKNLELTDATVPSENDWNRLYRVQHEGAVGQLGESDRPWLEAALAYSSMPHRRGVALQALLQLWIYRGRAEDEAARIVAEVQDDPNLTEEVRKRTAPPGPNPEVERMERNDRRRRCIAEARESKRLEQWRKWREEICADPESAFMEGRRDATIATLSDWLRAKSDSSTRYDCWDENALKEAIGERVTGLAVAAFRAFWRTQCPEMWSQRPPEERNSTPWVWIDGLCGLHAETSIPGWAKDLTAEEARVAAALATVELNGFPEWLSELAAAHPESVDAVLGVELTAQLDLAREQTHLPLLENLSRAGPELRRLFAPRLLANLRAWSQEITGKCSRGEPGHYVNRVIDILGDTLQGGEREQIAAMCGECVRSDPLGPFATTWLRGLCHFDLVVGVEALEYILSSTPEFERKERAVGIFAALFEERRGVAIRIPDSPERVEILRRLVRCVHLYVRPEEDRTHEGAYTPNSRDHAERARSYLLSSLLETPGLDAFRIIRELAEDPLFSHFPDRLRLLARRRAASDAEFSPFKPADIVALEVRLEAPPHDRDGLFAVMMDRLTDLQHDIAHHDFTDRVTLRSITEETEMQRTLAWRLDSAARGAYRVTREEEVADRKELDLRLATVGGEHLAAIEVKIADKRWSVRNFERALRNQLVGQYLRHARSKAGCLLLTYDGTKRYWKHPQTGAHLDFAAVVEHLSDLARSIERDMNYEIRLASFGLDLRDPELAPAHR